MSFIKIKMCLIRLCCLHYPYSDRTTNTLQNQEKTHPTHTSHRSVSKSFFFFFFFVDNTFRFFFFSRLSNDGVVFGLYFYVGIRMTTKFYSHSSGSCVLVINLVKVRETMVLKSVSKLFLFFNCFVDTSSCFFFYSILRFVKRKHFTKTIFSNFGFSFLEFCLEFSVE